MKRAGFLAVLLCVLIGTARCAWALIITLDAPPVLSISDDNTGSFTLTFPSFLQGTLSSTQSVLYRIQANNMVNGTVSGAVSARLDEAFDGIDLEGAVTGYQNLGGNNFASLHESQSGYRVIQTGQTSLTDKMPGTGTGDTNLDGNLTITWRGRLTTNAAAGQRSHFLIVTILEGS